MKRIETYIPLLLLLVAVISCTDEEKEYQPDLYVSFNPAITANTRAQAGEYPQEVPFAVWLYSLPEKKTWSKYHSNATLLADKAVVTNNDGCWSNIPAIFWPHKQNITAFAYSPLDIDADYSHTEGITIEEFDVTSGCYPLFTYPITDISSRYNGGCIAVPFVSALAKIEFRARSMAQIDTVLHLRSLSLDNVHYKGRFNSSPRATWTPTDEVISLEFCEEDIPVEVSSQIIGSKMVLPQTASLPVILVVDVYDNEGTLVEAGRKIVSRPLECNWNVGKYYSYTLNITTDSVTFTTDIFDNYDARNK